MVSPSDKRIAVNILKGEYGYSERRACKLLAFSRSLHQYEKKLNPNEAALRAQIRALASDKRRYGYLRIVEMLTRAGTKVNKKRVHRIWKDEGLQIPRKRPRKRFKGRHREVVHKATHPNHVWTWDFVFDRMENGDQLKILTVIDEYTKENLVLHCARQIGSEKVIQILSELFVTRGIPEFIRSDNGPEFIAKGIQEWLADYPGCEVMYIKPGSPWENPYIESFNGKLRDECLNMNLFMNLRDSRIILAEYQKEYNVYRPHSSLGYLTPAEFAQRASGVLRATPFVPLKQREEEPILS